MVGGKKQRQAAPEEPSIGSGDEKVELLPPLENPSQVALQFASSDSKWLNCFRCDSQNVDVLDLALSE